MTALSGSADRGAGPGHRGRDEPRRWRHGAGQVTGSCWRVMLRDEAGPFTPVIVAAGPAEATAKADQIFREMYGQGPTLVQILPPIRTCQPDRNALEGTRALTELAVIRAAGGTPSSREPRGHRRPPTSRERSVS